MSARSVAGSTFSCSTLGVESARRTLLPKLLPNSVGRNDTKGDEEHLQTPKYEGFRDVPDLFDTGWHERNQIRSRGILNVDWS